MQIKNDWLVFPPQHADQRGTTEDDEIAKTYCCCLFVCLVWYRLNRVDLASLRVDSVCVCVHGSCSKGLFVLQTESGEPALIGVGNE